MIYNRNAVIKIMQSWYGAKKGGSVHKNIIDTYNNHKPLARGYKVTYTDNWCAATISAAYIKAGYADICPLECSCGQMIAKAQKMGIWQENDNYVPKPADIIMYDWGDNGKGDCTGWPEHVGLVMSVNGKSIYVLEGNKNGGVFGRTVAIGGRYIQGYVTPKFTELAAVPAPAPADQEETIRKVVAKHAAAAFKADYAGTYTSTASSLNVRTGAGTDKDVLTKIPKGTKVKNYGFYTKVNGQVWLYVEFRQNNTIYNGFATLQYLDR